MFCIAPEIYQSLWLQFILAAITLETGVIFLTWKLGKTFYEHYKQKLIIAASILFSVIIFFLFSGVTFLILLFLYLHDDHPPSQDYHVLNAAIKNTCYLDPLKQHCPKTVSDLINIEPDNFTYLTRNAHLTYQYYPQTNEYTLIVRNNDLAKDDYRVVVFDPRLTRVKDYGTGLDFIDTDVTTCTGGYSLKNPPPFNGPWNNIN